jgi:hypothetical protein
VPIAPTITTSTPQTSGLPTPTATPATAPTPAPTAAPSAARRWGLIGNRTTASGEHRAAGLSIKVVRLSWKDLEPKEGQISTAYVSAKRIEIASLRAAGLDVIVDSGLHDTPQWMHTKPNSYLVSQHGERWQATTDGDLAIDKSDANLIFNPALRTIAATYLRRIGGLFGSTIHAVRIGGGRWNELGYPPPTTSTHTNSYWAYDALAQQQSPVPGWKPGDPSPNGEAQQFYSWYLQALVDFQQWQIDSVRRTFSGPVMVLYPGWGVRPGQAAAAVADRLRNRTPPELNAEIQRGFDWTSQVAAIKDPLVFPATTWVDARFGSDASDATQWRPVHFLRSLAGPQATLWGENTGQGTPADLAFAAAQTVKYDLAGMVWFREEELGTNGWATLADYRAVIAASSS